MRHDFDPNPGDDRLCTTDGSVCTDDGGVMDYFQVNLFKIFFLLKKQLFVKYYSVSIVYQMLKGIISQGSSKK